MSSFRLPVNRELWSASRLSGLTSPQDLVRAREIVFLLFAGACAALASGLIDFSLRIPGHAILRVIFPMTLGLALVPRKGAGTVMAAGAFSTGLFLRGTGIVAGMSIGAFTSLIVTGPLLDLTLRRTKNRSWIYLNCAIAGLLSNSVAMSVRGLSKFLGWERLGRVPVGEWFSRAVLTYPVCGLLAGLLCAIILFSMRATEPESVKGEE
ncbi:hypothetical protein [Thalassoglobus sp.]|uniref:hypothetical protein n=1 Tax=Thalassoglobus sp. TaxID=2795869 RepID=UPI003AA7F020